MMVYEYAVGACKGGVSEVPRVFLAEYQALNPFLYYLYLLLSFIKLLNFTRTVNLVFHNLLEPDEPFSGIYAEAVQRAK